MESLGIEWKGMSLFRFFMVVCNIIDFDIVLFICCILEMVFFWFLVFIGDGFG